MKARLEPARDSLQRHPEDDHTRHRCIHRTSKDELKLKSLDPLLDGGLSSLFGDAANTLLTACRHWWHQHYTLKPYSDVTITPLCGEDNQLQALAMDEQDTVELVRVPRLPLN